MIAAPPPEDNDYDGEPDVDAITGFQVILIIILIFANMVAAITMHPQWFGG